MFEVDLQARSGRVALPRVKVVLAIATRCVVDGARRALRRALDLSIVMDMMKVISMCTEKWSGVLIERSGEQTE